MTNYRKTLVVCIVKNLTERLCRPDIGGVFHVSPRSQGYAKNTNKQQISELAWRKHDINRLFNNKCGYMYFNDINMLSKTT